MFSQGFITFISMLSLVLIGIVAGLLLWMLISDIKNKKVW